MALRLEALTGLHEARTNASEGALLAAVCDVLLMLVVFAAIAAAIGVIRTEPRAGARKLAVTPLAPTSN
jgi:hypothetical protein